MTAPSATRFEYNYPVTNVQAHDDGDTFVFIDVVNFDAKEKLREILAEFQGVETVTANMGRVDIEDIHNQPSSALDFDVTENNIEDLVDMLIAADAVTEEEADEIEPAEIKERIAGLAPDERNKIFDALEIKNGKIMSIEWEDKLDRFHEKGQISVGLKAQNTQDLINMINSDSFKPDGTPIFDTDERQYDLF